MSLCPSLYPAWEGAVAIPVTDFKPNFDFLLVRSSESENGWEADALANAIRTSLAGKTRHYD